MCDTMDGYSLNALMQEDKHVSPYFEGVFAADTLPRRLQKSPALLICNTDPISKPGQHWVAFFIGSDGRGEYFDSYGMPPLVKQHRQWLQSICKSWKYNHTTLQCIDSEVCGEYCVLYLVHRAHHYSMSKFVKKCFTTNTEKNDTMVKTLFHRMFSHKHKKCILPSDIYTQKCCAKKF